MTKTTMRIAYLLLFTLLLSAVAYSLTASIGNGRAIVRINATPDNPAIFQRTIAVNNVNDIPVRINVTVDRDFDRFVEILNPEFVLEPGESEDVMLHLKFEGGGMFEGKFFISYLPADPGESKNGVGLTATLIVLSEGPIIKEPDEGTEDAAASEEVSEKQEPDSAGSTESSGSSEEPADASVQEGREAAGSQSGIQATGTGKSNGPSIIVGIIIILTIVGIGTAAFFIAARPRK